MTQANSLDQTQRLILYLVINLTKGVPHLLVQSGGVLTTMLAKLLFLIDVWSAEIDGSQVTDFRYIRYKFGPYPLAQFEERLEKLQEWGLYPIGKVSIEEGKRYRIYRLDRKPEVSLDLPSRVKLLADEIMTTFATQKLDDVLSHVYSLDFVRKTPFGEPIDLELLRKKADVLSGALNLFGRDLGTPLPEEHRNAVEQARKEGSNENVEMARAMTEKQRKAFQFKQGS